MGRRLVLALVVVLAAFAVGLCVHGGQGVVRGGFERAVDPPAPAASVAPAAAARGTIGDAPVGRNVVAAAEDGRHDLELLVVEAATGEPVAGAEVLYIDLRTRVHRHGMRAVVDLVGLFSDPVALLQRAGARARSDGRGRAWLNLPVSDDPAVRVLARAPGLVGYAVFPEEDVGDGDGVWRLELGSDRTLRVQVVDAVGAPLAGVPVALACERDVPRGTAEPVRQVWVLPLGATGGDGICTLRHARYFGVRTAREAAGQRPARPFLDVPGWPRPAAPVDLADPPAEPIVLTAPAAGSVLVRVFGPTRGACGTGSEVTLRCGAVAPDLPAVLRERTWRARVDDRGEARFARVALGERFVATLDLAGTRLERSFGGPVRVGEQTTVDLAADAASVLLTGRAVDPESAPLAERAFHTWLSIGDAVFWRKLTTDAAGRFELLVGSPLLERGAARLRATLYDDGDRPTDLLATREIGPLGRGRTDLGDLRFGAAPLLLAGRIVDDGGEPVRAVGLHIEQLVPDGGWDERHELRARVELDGRFRFHGDAGPGRLRLEVRSRRHLPIEPIEFERGADDLLVRLAEGGVLEAKLVGEPGVDLAQVAVELVPEHEQGEPLRGSPQGGGWSRGTKTIAWAGLAPGSYRLELRCPGSAEPSVALPGLVVPSGGVCEDPRLDPIDLRGRVRQVRITVVDAAGERVRDRRGQVLIASARRWAVPRSVPLRGGVAELVLTAPSVSVLVEAPGYLPERVDGVSEDTTVRLEAERALRLRFRLAGGRPQLPAGHSLYVHLTFDTRRQQSPRPAATTYDALEARARRHAHYLRFDEFGDAEVEVERLGACRLGAGVRGPGGAATVPGLSPRTLEITVASEASVFELTLPDDAIEQGLQLLAGGKGAKGGR